MSESIRPQMQWQIAIYSREVERQAYRLFKTVWQLYRLEKVLVETQDKPDVGASVEQARLIIADFVTAVDAFTTGLLNRDNADALRGRVKTLPAYATWRAEARSPLSIRYLRSFAHYASAEALGKLAIEDGDDREIIEAAYGQLTGQLIGMGKALRRIVYSYAETHGVSEPAAAAPDSREDAGVTAESGPDTDKADVVAAN